MKRYNIIVVDDHKLIANGICLLIDSLDEFSVSYDVRNGNELISLLKDKKNIPDLILLDINMPVMNGFETMEWIKQHHPEIPVMALSINNDDESVLRMLRLGVKGYLPKDCDADELAAAMKAILERGFYYSDLVNQKLMNNLRGEERGNDNNVVLKERELEFLQWACSDLTYAQIADKMCLSPKTVDHYREALFEKFDVKSRVGLVLFAIRNKLYSYDDT